MKLLESLGMMMGLILVLSFLSTGAIKLMVDFNLLGRTSTGFIRGGMEATNELESSDFRYEVTGSDGRGR